MKGQHFRNQTVESIKSRFWDKVDKTPGHGPKGDCWIWTSTISKGGGGYGQFKFNCKAIPAHRFSYELNCGLIPDGLLVCHTCDNPPCVNPSHLWLGTVLSNSQDMLAKGRGPTGDKNGMRLHPEKVARGSKHWLSTINESQALEIRNHWDTTERKWGLMSFLAKKYEVSRKCVYRIVYRQGWNHI